MRTLVIYFSGGITALLRKNNSDLGPFLDKTYRQIPHSTKSSVCSFIKQNLHLDAMCQIMYDAESDIYTSHQNDPTPFAFLDRKKRGQPLNTLWSSISHHLSSEAQRISAARIGDQLSIITYRFASLSRQYHELCISNAVSPRPDAVLIATRLSDEMLSEIHGLLNDTYILTNYVFEFYRIMRTDSELNLGMSLKFFLGWLSKNAKNTSDANFLKIFDSDRGHIAIFRRYRSAIEHALPLRTIRGAFFIAKRLQLGSHTIETVSMPLLVDHFENAGHVIRDISKCLDHKKKIQEMASTYNDDALLYISSTLDLIRDFLDSVCEEYALNTKPFEITDDDIIEFKLG
jgi:hypothetical protein